MKVRSLILGALAATALAGVASAATAPAPSAPAANRTCFFTRNWESWKAPDANTLYLKVFMHDIYRVDLSSGSDMLTWPDSHLINKVRGTDSVCSPIDLDLSVSNGSGIRVFLIAKAITKLTPEEIAAIPKKDLP
jgi:hypothetical protein